MGSTRVESDQPHPGQVRILNGGGVTKMGSDPWEEDAPLVDRLRWHARNDDLSPNQQNHFSEAADEIERLRTWVRDEVLTGETMIDDKTGEVDAYAGWLSTEHMIEPYDTLVIEAGDRRIEVTVLHVHVDGQSVPAAGGVNDDR